MHGYQITNIHVDASIRKYRSPRTWPEVFRSRLSLPLHDFVPLDDASRQIISQVVEGLSKLADLPKADTPEHTSQRRDDCQQPFYEVNCRSKFFHGSVLVVVIHLVQQSLDLSNLLHAIFQ